MSYVSEQPPTVTPSGWYGTRIEEKTRGRIQSYLQSRADWNLSRSLKNLVEQAVRDYEHRALVELLQNAHDAHGAAERAGRVLVRLDHDEDEHGVLYLANTGSGFTDSNFDAITDVAQSDKRPEEGIGNKGIGFKSVLQLSRVPEIYSTAASDPSAARAGYCFRFATQPDLIRHLEQLGRCADIAATAADVERDVFHLCLPVALDKRPAIVDSLWAAGYVTVIRLPLKSEEARADATEQLRVLMQGPPTLLFLRRIARLTLDEIRDGQTSTTSLERVERPLAELDDATLAQVSLSDTGTYLIAEKPLPAATFADAIARSIAGDHISGSWADWNSEVHVAVALRLDAELDNGRLYTYLPMGEDAHAPLPAHVNAPFFAKLARVNLEQSVPLNDMLLDQVAELCARLLLAAAKNSVPIDSGVLIGLLTWTASSTARLRAAFERLGSNVATAAVVPLSAAERGWASLSDVFTWEDAGRRVMTVAGLRAHADVPVVAELSKQRVKRLDQTARTLAARRLAPTEVDVADWAERIADWLVSRPFDPDAWGAFYDELAHTIRDRQALFGRKILVDDDGILHGCNSLDGDGRSPVAFFAPRADSNDRDGPDADLRPPTTLQHRVFFVSQRITWNRRSGAVLAKRPGRRMLEDGLVHEYRAADLLPVISDALERRQTPELAAEVLIWTYRFASTREEPPWREIRNMRLLVPVRDGQWIPAEQALLSKGWGGDEVTLLDDLLNHAADLSDDFADLRSRLTIDPTEGPFDGLPLQQLRDFLLRIGVRAGLHPDPVPQSTLRGQGQTFESGHSLTPTGLPSLTASVWRQAIAERLPSRLRPYTDYRSQTPLYRLAGQDDHAKFPAATKMLYARLVSLGLSTWPEETLNVTVHRHNDSNDRFTLPTPVTAFLTQNSWVPTTTPGDRTKVTYVRAGEAWSHPTDAPAFASTIAPPVRRLLHRDASSEARAKSIGIRSWDDRATAVQRLRLLAALLETGQVPDTVLTQFRNAYESAWIDAVAISPDETPLDGDPRAPIVVTRGSRLDVVDLRGSNGDAEVVYVQDTEARQNLHLLEQCAAPVLKLRHAHAAQVAACLERAFGSRIRRVSQIDVAVRIDDRPFTASAKAPLLAGPDRSWLADLVAAVVELRSSRFRHTGTETLRRTVAHLHRLRLVLAGDIEADVDDHTVVASHTGTRWLAIDDEENPTVIVQRRDLDDDMRVLERASTPVAEILGFPELGDTIRVTLIELASLGYGPAHPPGTNALAEALSESPQRIDEIRLAIRRPDNVALDVLVPLVAVWDLPAARDLETSPDTSVSPTDLAKWLIDLSGSTVDVRIVLAAAADRDLDRARQALGVDLRRLNAAIQQLGTPYQELKDPESITQQFRHFVTVHSNQILDALRQAFLDDYSTGKSLDQYLAYRDLTALAIDRAWIEDYLVVPGEIIQAHVNRWLGTAGAGPLREDLVLEPVDTLRRDNRTRVLTWLSEATDIIRAYERTLQLPASNLPGDAVDIADALTGTGLLDFEQLGVERFLAWLRDTARWPTDMPLTLDDAALGLPPTALKLAEQDREEARKLREDSRRRITVDGHDMVAEQTNYPQIVAAVKAGITQDFLSASATTGLNELPPAARRRPGAGRPGTTAARRSTTSAAQTAAIGLAGEVAALEWVKNQYPGVTDLEAWKSGYRNQVLGDLDGDDTLGYDIVVDTDKYRIMFEVKATSGDITEFHLTDAEIVRARNLKRRERYQILFVTHALDSNLRRIHLLPNPLDPKHARFYRTVGDGIRYRFDIATGSA